MCTHVDGNSCFVHILHNIGGTKYREYTVVDSRYSAYLRVVSRGFTQWIFNFNAINFTSKHAFS